MLIRCGWPEMAASGAQFLDPMCGSGTLVIEAAMIAAPLANVPVRDEKGLQHHDGSTHAVMGRSSCRFRYGRSVARVRKGRTSRLNRVERHDECRQNCGKYRSPGREDRDRIGIGDAKNSCATNKAGVAAGPDQTSRCHPGRVSAVGRNVLFPSLVWTTVHVDPRHHVLTTEGHRNGRLQ